MSCHGKGACRDEEHVPHQLWTSMGPLAALAAAQLCIFVLHLVLCALGVVKQSASLLCGLD